MRADIFRWTEKSHWEPDSLESFPSEPDIVLVFGERYLLDAEEPIQELRKTYPDSVLTGCSTSGEIFGTQVDENSVVALPISFEQTRVRTESQTLQNADESYDAASSLARTLWNDELQHVLVLSNGVEVNGTKLTSGFNDVFPDTVKVSGGLAGDGDRFEQTLTILNDQNHEDLVTAIGFYGDALTIGFGSQGGWDPFGPERLITHSEDNTLFEVDDKPALELYKRYLGEHAEDLPASGLLFPLSLRDPDDGKNEHFVRTILGVDEENQSMIFAGDVPEGYYARLMKANFDRLIEGARSSAETAHEMTPDTSPDLALLISCVGRKQILKQRTEEEVESVRNVLGSDTTIGGFYSYGEISPSDSDVGDSCLLHNQTMTITTMSEDL